MKLFEGALLKMSVFSFGAFIKLRKAQCTKTQVSPQDRGQAAYSSSALQKFRPVQCIIYLYLKVTLTLAVVQACSPLPQPTEPAGPADARRRATGAEAARPGPL